MKVLKLDYHNQMYVESLGLTKSQESSTAFLSQDEFGDHRSQINRLVRTGRQRKKLAARSKGGEFQTRRRKKRVYFCCVSSDIDVQKLFDYLVGAGGLLYGWKYQLYNDVLHLYKAGLDDGPPPAPSHLMDNPPNLTRLPSIDSRNEESDAATAFSTSYNPLSASKEPDNGIESNVMNHNIIDNSSLLQTDENLTSSYQHESATAQNAENNAFRISNVGAQEVFVFDFGAVVFWGFSRGEETNLLKTIRMFVTKGFVETQEFQSGEDDMAFVTTDAKTISIANDVISLPEDSM